MTFLDLSKVTLNLLKVGLTNMDAMRDINASSHNATNARVKFGEFVFDRKHRCLIRSDRVVKLEPQLSELLQIFVENAGEIISKSHILDVLWRDRVVSDDAFRAVIKKLRKHLNDDARTPRFIQTLPLKGYRFIAEVEEVEVPSAVTSHLNARWVTAFTIFAVLSVLLLYTLIQPTPMAVTSLTEMDGSEVSPSYNASLKHLVFSHRANHDDYLQLFTKSLDSGKVTRLSFADANDANGHLSPDGSQLAFTRSTPSDSAIYVADFSADIGLSNLQQLPVAVSANRYMQAWNADGTGLYLSDLNQPEDSKGIWFYHVESAQLSRLTSPSSLGRGDFFARESHNGEYLALLRNTGPGENELIVQHLESGELSHIHKLPTSYSNLTWGATDDDISLSSFYSDFGIYSLADRNLREINLDIQNTNHIFHSCGHQCIFARQHDGNYLDLSLQPNPFKPEAVSSYEYLQQPGAEELPIFGANSKRMYFINREDGTSQLVVADMEHRHVLKQFPVDAEFGALQVSTDESHIAGLVNNRLFLLETDTGHFQYLSTELDNIVSLNWVSGFKELQFARIEGGTPTLYRYELESKQRIRVGENQYAKAFAADGSKLVIDANLNVWLGSAEQPPRLLSRVESASPNRWKLTSKALYHTAREENLTFLLRTDLETGITDKMLLGKNRYRIDFDLSADSMTLLSVRSVLAQSNLVKVEF